MLYPYHPDIHLHSLSLGIIQPQYNSSLVSFINISPFHTLRSYMYGAFHYTLDLSNIPQYKVIINDNPLFLHRRRIKLSYYGSQIFVYSRKLK